MAMRSALMRVVRVAAQPGQGAPAQLLGPQGGDVHEQEPAPGRLGNHRPGGRRFGNVVVGVVVEVVVSHDL